MVVISIVAFVVVEGQFQVAGEKGSSSSTGLNLSLLQWACWLLSHPGAAVEVIGCLVEGVGREYGWFNGAKGFGVLGIGSCSTEQKAARSPSKQPAKAGCSHVEASLG